MNALIVSYDPFAMESRVSIYKDGQQECVPVCSNVNELVEQLTALAYENNIYSVKFHGPLAVTAEVKRAIEDYEKNLYSNNKIVIEGI